MSVSSMLITAAVTAFVPWLTALVTKTHAHQALKVGVTTLLSGVTAVLVQVQADPGFAWQEAILYTLEGVGVATLAHLNLWKPAGITGSTGAIQTRVPGGLGRVRQYRH